MYLLYPKNPTWRWLRGIPKNFHNFLMTVRPLSWACGHGTEMLLILKQIFLTWLFPIFSDMTVQRHVPRFCTRSICGWNLFQPLDWGYSWPNLTFMCTKVAQSSIHFIYTCLEVSPPFFLLKKTVQKHSIESSVPYRLMRIKSVILIKWWCFVVDRDKRHATCFLI